MGEGLGYSRDAYEQALSEKQTGINEATDAEVSLLENQYHAKEDHRRAVLRIDEAEQRLRQLMETAQDEANALNEEYSQRVQEVDEAIRRLHAFEQEKLGMGNGEPGGQIIGAIDKIGEQHEQK